jgi:ketosteroid isomerase-like protein
MSDPSLPPLTAERLASLFASGPFTTAVFDSLVPYYAEDVAFTDPIQSLRGRDAFVAMNHKLIARVKELRFEMRGLAQEGDQIFLAWLMVVRPKVGPEVRIEGVTQCTLRDGKVAVHRDYWDLVGSLMEMIPLAGTVYKAAVRLLG